MWQFPGPAAALLLTAGCEPCTRSEDFLVDSDIPDDVMEREGFLNRGVDGDAACASACATMAEREQEGWTAAEVSFCAFEAHSGWVPPDSDETDEGDVGSLYCTLEMVATCE